MIQSSSPSSLQSAQPHSRPKLSLELSPAAADDAAVAKFRMLAPSPRSTSIHTATAPTCGPAWSAYDLGNVSLVCALGALIGTMYIVNPVHHRFIINAQDPAINYPLMAQTVPVWLLGVLVFILPVCAILWICESTAAAAMSDEGLESGHRLRSNSGLEGPESGPRALRTSA